MIAYSLYLYFLYLEAISTHNMDLHHIVVTRALLNMFDCLTNILIHG